MIKIFNSVEGWKEFRKTQYFNNKTIGLVTTMGNLHEGHKHLMMQSVAQNDVTILSVFINPTQFNCQNDLVKYPRTPENDIQLAKSAGVDCVLMPNYEDMYPDEYRYKVTESTFSKELCGKFRPGHFDGMLTVVLKLLMLAKANRAYFGEKDFQQLQLVKEMVSAFFIDTEIVGVATIRNEQGLALSSRNNLLNNEQLELAPDFFKLLKSELPIEVIKQQLINKGFKVEYIEEHLGRRLGAVILGNVRLIDNVEYDVYSSL